MVSTISFYSVALILTIAIADRLYNEGNSFLLSIFLGAGIGVVAACFLIQLVYIVKTKLFASSKRDYKK